MLLRDTVCLWPATFPQTATAHCVERPSIMGDEIRSGPLSRGRVTGDGTCNPGTRDWPALPVRRLAGTGRAQRTWRPSEALVPSADAAPRGWVAHTQVRSGSMRYGGSERAASPGVRPRYLLNPVLKVVAIPRWPVGR
jgi:hypothetical protein